MPQKCVSAKTAAAKTGARTIARVSESAAASGTLTIAKAATPTPNASATSAPTETGRARVDGIAAARLAHHWGIRQASGNLDAPWPPHFRTYARGHDPRSWSRRRAPRTRAGDGRLAGVGGRRRHDRRGGLGV